MKPKNIEIFQGQIKAVGEGTLIYTTGLHTCLGVAIFDAGTKLGVLGHLNGSGDFAMNQLELVVKSIVAESEFTQSTKYHVLSPIALLDRQVILEIEEARGRAKRLLERYAHGREVHYHFAEPGNYFKLLELNVGLGQVTIHEAKTDFEILDRWGT